MNINMEYPSLFDLSYNNEYNNIDEFHLECLETLKLDIWKETFVFNESDILEINYSNITKLFADLNKCFKSNFNFAGKSFSQQKISLGTIHNYYIQYLASKLFNNINLLEPFNNLNDLKKTIDNNIENVIHETISKENINNFNIKSIIDNSKQKKFLHFKIFIKNLNTFSSDNIKNTCWHIHMLLV